MGIYTKGLNIQRINIATDVGGPPDLTQVGTNPTYEDFRTRNSTLHHIEDMVQ